MRILRSNDQANVDASVTNPIYLIEWGHSGSTEYLSTAGSVTYDSQAYTAGGANITNIKDNTKATIVLPATSTRVTEVVTSTWRRQRCKIYLILAAAGDTGPFTADEGRIFIDGFIENSSWSGEQITVTITCNYLRSAMTPRLKISDVCQHIPAVGTTLSWDGETYAYIDNEEMDSPVGVVDKLRAGPGWDNTPAAGRPNSVRSNGVAGGINPGFQPITGENAYVPLGYGRFTATGKVFADSEFLGNKIIGVVWCLGPCFEIESVYIGDTPLPTDCGVRHYLGTLNQVPDQWLEDLIPGYTDDLIFHTPHGDVGVCYSVFNIPSSATTGRPIFRAIIKGRLVIDPDGNGTSDPYHDLVGFSFDFNTSGTDIGPNSHTLTLVGDATVSGGLQLDGTGDYATLADDSTLDIGIEKWCWEGEDEPDVVTGTETLISHTNSATTRSFQIDRNATNYKLYLSSDGTTWDIANGVNIGTAAVDTKTNLKVVYDGYDVVAYQDGQQFGNRFAYPSTGLDTVTNGGFATDTNWTKGTGWTISGGTANSDGTQTADSSLTQTQTVVTGAVYDLSFDLVTAPSAGGVKAEVGGTEVVALQTLVDTYTARVTILTGTSIDIEIIADADFDGSIDNVKFEKVVGLFESGVQWQIGAYNGTQEYDGTIYTSRLTIGAQRYGGVHEATAQPFSDSGDYEVNQIYSEKPALVWNDVALNRLFGLSALETDITGCVEFGDELMDSGAPRCRIGILQTTPVKTIQFLDSIAEHASCIHFPEGSKMKLVPDKPQPSGKNIVVQGTFDEYDAAWVYSAYWSIQDGVARRTAQSATQSMTQTLTTVDGTTYYISIELVAYTQGNVSVKFAGVEVIAPTSTLGTHTAEVTASGTSNNIELVADGQFIGDVDNVIVQELEYNLAGWGQSSFQIASTPDADQPNTVSVKYWKQRDDSPSWQRKTFTVMTLGAGIGTEPIIQATLDMPGINRIEEASNKAIVKLQRVTDAFRGDWISIDEGVAFEPGDIIQCTSAPRGLNTRFWVESNTMSGSPAYGRHRISARNYSDDHYSDEDYTESDGLGLIGVNGTNPNITGVVTLPIGSSGGYSCQSFSGATGVVGAKYHWPCNLGAGSKTPDGRLYEARADNHGTIFGLNGSGTLNHLATPGLTDNCTGYHCAMLDQFGNEYVRAYDFLPITGNHSIAGIISQNVPTGHVYFGIYWGASHVQIGYATGDIQVSVVSYRNPSSPPYNTQTSTNKYYPVDSVWERGTNFVSAFVVSTQFYLNGGTADSYTAVEVHNLFTSGPSTLIEAFEVPGAVGGPQENPATSFTQMFFSGGAAEDLIYGGTLSVSDIAILKAGFDNNFN